MTTISAKIIADSISPAGKRLTTLQLRYPRFIHAEFMTHRMFSRNASSSRAIPAERLIQDVEWDIAHPLHWGKNQKGMQAHEEVSDLDALSAHSVWNAAARAAVDYARFMADLGIHKQIVNRLLEPFSHINVVVTATEWDNFFDLRRHEAAEPHIHLLADRIWAAMEESEPTPLQPGQWHLPYIEPGSLHHDVLIKISAARCARVSYQTHDGRATTVEEDLALAERLLADKHMSPFEHQGTPDYWNSANNKWDYPELHGNFAGWIQNRKWIS